MFVKNISLLSMVTDKFIISNILNYCYVFKSRYFVVSGKSYQCYFYLLELAPYLSGVLERRFYILQHNFYKPACLRPCRMCANVSRG